VLGLEVLCKVIAGIFRYKTLRRGDIYWHPDWHRMRDAVDEFTEFDELVESDTTDGRMERPPMESSGWRLSGISKRRRSDSNRRILVLQTNALTAWLRRLNVFAKGSYASIRRIVPAGCGREGNSKSFITVQRVCR
jgi:hypothetical protein